MNAPAGRSVIEDLEPQLVWRYFAGIAAVPRPSMREEKIRAHVRRLAASLKLAAREDHAGNMVIDVPATRGCEQAAPVLLQGHLDMVCEKDAGVAIDFENEGIRPVIKTHPDGAQFVHAQGTTLGADNGIGVALALAAATDPKTVHGPLEILCTIDEETGMTGAKSIEPSFFKSRRMLNLDSEEDDALYIGCAGGTDTTLKWSLRLSAIPSGGAVCRVSVSGLKGGHSGCDIHLNRGSAIAMLSQVLHAVEAQEPRLISIGGGSKRNAIPREASAILAVPTSAVAALKAAAAAVQDQAAGQDERDCRIVVESASATAAASATDTQRVLGALAAVPHGVLAVVPDIPGLVQTSNGATTISSTTEDGIVNVAFGCLSRSSSKPDMETTLRRLAAIGRLSGAVVECGNDYPGWAPNANSPTLAVCRGVYERVLGHAPRIASIHAGLECGIIGERVGGMDMVSFGPNIRGAHSPNEHVEVASVARMYRYLLAVLEELARTPR